MKQNIYHWHDWPDHALFANSATHSSTYRKLPYPEFGTEPQGSLPNNFKQIYLPEQFPRSCWCDCLHRQPEDQSTTSPPETLVDIFHNLAFFNNHRLKFVWKMRCSKPSVGIKGQSNYHLGLYSDVCNILVPDESVLGYFWHNSLCHFELPIIRASALSKAGSTMVESGSKAYSTGCTPHIYLAEQRWR
ncbi:hypothetical protein T4E_425 [Trichinella pseudospiralis]|uniref:Uncharacterized protein n=1 Tax=Trichinella pseudospiralis TaxID=6337 RepID=A0A0V0XEJ9_TRIPS|nr:hypothetical protein T4E_425 [Trichinella pseudospiralis]